MMIKYWRGEMFCNHMIKSQFFSQPESWGVTFRRVSWFSFFFFFLSIYVIQGGRRGLQSFTCPPPRSDEVLGMEASSREWLCHEQRILSLLEKGRCSPPPARSIREFFSDLHRKNLVGFPEVKLMKACPSPARLKGSSTLK